MEDDYSDGVSENDDGPNDVDFVPPTLQQKEKSKDAMRKLFTTNQKSKRSKDDNQNDNQDHQNQDNNSDHDSNQNSESDQGLENELDKESEQELDQESPDNDIRKDKKKN